MKAGAHILVFRTDRLGDLLMSLPAVCMLRASLPEATISLVCQKAFHAVLTDLCAQWRVSLIELSPFDHASGFRAVQCEAALFLRAGARHLMAAAIARVPIRIGILSKPLSFLLLTRGLRQKRSRAEKNEAEYNNDLAEALLLKLKRLPEKVDGICIPINHVAKQRAEVTLRDCGIDLNRPFMVIHPGMGGSALNLTAAHYAALYRKLSANSQVVVTCGPAAQDRQMKDLLVAEITTLPVIQDADLPALAEIFRLAKMVIAPSTGPLHLAHYVAASTIGLFSPVRTHHPQRWAPQGGTGKAVSLLPQVACPAAADCLGGRCAEYPCMGKMDWTLAVEQAIRGCGAR